MRLGTALYARYDQCQGKASYSETDRLAVYGAERLAVRSCHEPVERLDPSAVDLSPLGPAVSLLSSTGNQQAVARSMALRRGIRYAAP